VGELGASSEQCIKHLLVNIMVEGQAVERHAHAEDVPQQTRGLISISRQAEPQVLQLALPVQQL
jgi:hypothetical protein